MCSIFPTTFKTAMPDKQTTVTRKSFRTTIVEVEETPVVPLAYPEKVTLKWIVDNVPVSALVAAVGVVPTVFYSGWYLSKLMH